MSMTKSQYDDLENLTISELQEQLRLEEEIDYRLKHRKSDLYTPLQKTFPFHISPASKRVLSGGNRCLLPTTSVRLWSGLCKEIQALRPGDLVVGADPEGNTFPVEVLEVIDSGVLPVYRWVLGGRKEEASLLCTEDHKVAVRRDYRGSRPLQRSSTMPLIQAFPTFRKKWEYSIVRSRGHAHGRTDALTPCALLLGFFIGDGYIRRRTLGGRRIVQLSSAEPQEVHYLIDLYPGLVLRKSGGANYTYNARGTCCGFDIKDLFYDLLPIDKLAQDKTIPEVCYEWDNSAVAAILSGLFTTDGSVFVCEGKYPHISFGNTSKRLVQQVQELLAVRFGIYGAPIATNISGRKRPMYIVNYGTYGALSLFHKHVGFVGRKQDILSDILQQWKGKRSDGNTVRLMRVDWVGELRTMDISVSGDHHLFVLANGCVVSNSSKTTAGVLEDVMAFSGEYPEWYPRENRRKQPNKGRIVVEDFKKGALDIIEPKFKEWCPDWPSMRKTRDKTTGALVRVENPKTGSFFDVMTNNQPTDLHEGADFDWLHFDEPPPHDKFVASARGLIDRGGRCWITCTLLKQPWIIQDLFEPWQNGDKDIDFFFCETDDNSTDRGGYLKPKDIEDYFKFLDDDQLEVRRGGKFGRLDGKIIKKFNRKVHTILLEGPHAIPEHWQRYCVMDPHDSKPTYVAWVALSPPQPVSFAVWYREAMFGDMIVEQIVTAIRQLEGQERIFLRIMDPNKGNTPTVQTGLTMKQAYAKHDMYFIDGNDSLKLGHLEMKKWFNYDPSRPVDMTNYPVMVLAHYLTYMIKSCERYAWDTDASGRPVLAEEAKPAQKWKDFMDLIRYFCASMPYFQGSSLWTPGRKVIPITTKHRMGGIL